MDVGMSINDVITQIKDLQTNGVSLAKKKVKKSHPDLMRSALYYYPSWEHALQENGVQ